MATKEKRKYTKKEVDYSIPLVNEASEEYAYTCVVSPHLPPFDTYMRLVDPDNKLKNPAQSHYNYKNTVAIQGRMEYLYSVGVRQADSSIEQTFIQLNRSRDALFAQSHDVHGNITSQAHFTLYMKVVDQIAKLKGQYNHVQVVATIDSTTETRKAALDKLLEEKLGVE